MRDASGAEVCGSNVASGSQGAICVSNTAMTGLYPGPRTGLPGGAGSTLVSLDLVSAALCFDASTFRGLSLGAPRRSGLLVRDTKVSFVVTWTLSVLLSSTVRLEGLGFPDAVRLWDVREGAACGDGPCLLESDRSLLKLSWALMRGGRGAALSWALPFTPYAELREAEAEAEDIVSLSSSASVKLFCHLPVREERSLGGSACGCQIKCLQRLNLRSDTRFAGQRGTRFCGGARLNGDVGVA